jgi:hypothetical protein
MSEGHLAVNHREQTPWAGCFTQRAQKALRTVCKAVFRLCCWSVVAWVVWNGALSEFLNADRIGPFESVGIGVLLCALSVVFEEAEALDIEDGTE